MLSHQAHTLFTALLSSFPEGPLDLYPVTGIADVWGEGPAPPAHSPLAALLEREGPRAGAGVTHSFQRCRTASSPPHAAAMHPYLGEGGGIPRIILWPRPLTVGAVTSDPRLGRSPGGRQLCAGGHGQPPEKRPHLPGPPECLSMKGSGQAHGRYLSGPGRPGSPCVVAPGHSPPVTVGRRHRPRHGGGGRLRSTGTAPLADPPQAGTRGCPPGPHCALGDSAPGGGAARGRAAQNHSQPPHQQVAHPWAAEAQVLTS